MTIDEATNLLARARIALTFYRRDMLAKAAPDVREYPYGREVEDEIREVIEGLPKSCRACGTVTDVLYGGHCGCESVVFVSKASAS